jgi:glycine/D-amino acid oxidase-like deaminating enzyme
VTAVRAGGVESTAGFHPGETVVLAAGTGIPALYPGVPVDPSPARRMRIATPPGLVRTILSGPDFEARENRPGELLATTLGRGGAAFERLRAAFPGAEPFRLLDSRVGLRPMPPGGPRIGYANPARPVYIAVMHSAICLAPTAGRLIARELATGTPAPELRHCRP